MALFAQQAGFQNRKKSGTGLFWLGAEDEVLRRYDAAGHSCSTIALVLSEQFRRPFTRNMVVGRRKRLGLPWRGRVDSWGPRRTKYKERQPLPETPPPVPLYVPEIHPQPVTLRDRTALQCHYPLGDTDGLDTIYCGAPVQDERNYCAGHCHIMYRKVPAITPELAVARSLSMLRAKRQHMIDRLVGRAA